MSQRSRFVQLVLEQYGMPYCWGGVGEVVASRENPPGRVESVTRVFDCSGLVKWALWKSAADPRQAVDWRAHVNTDGLLQKCRHTSVPAQGTLCLYGPSETDMNHVMVWLMPGLVVGACGGGRDDTDWKKSVANGAMVQFRPGHDYRKVAPFRFFVELPFADEQSGGPHS